MSAKTPFSVRLSFVRSVNRLASKNRTHVTIYGVLSYRGVQVNRQLLSWCITSPCSNCTIVSSWSRGVERRYALELENPRAVQVSLSSLRVISSPPLAAALQLARKNSCIVRKHTCRSVLVTKYIHVLRSLGSISLCRFYMLHRLDPANVHSRSPSW